MTRNKADSQLLSSLSPNLASRLELIIQTIPLFWEQRIYLHFTSQGPTNSERICRILEQLALELPEDDRLANDEIFILFAAAWLYETGLQSPNLKPVLGFEYKPGKTLSSSQLQAIRDKKNLLSKSLIYDNISDDYKGKFLNLGLLRPADKRTFLIAEVCRWISNEPIEDVPNDDVVDGVRIRIRLVVALLRLADQLYIDGSRVNLDMLETAGLSDKTFARWWAYYFTQTLPIANGQIRFHYFLPSNQKEYLGHIRALIEPDFEFDNNSIIRYLWENYRLRLMPSRNPNVGLYDPDSGLMRPMSPELINIFRSEVTAISYLLEGYEEKGLKHRCLFVLDYEDFIMQLGQDGFFINPNDMGRLIAKLLIEANQEHDGPIDCIAIGNWKNPEFQIVARMLDAKVFDLVTLSPEERDIKVVKTLEDILSAKKPKRIIFVTPPIGLSRMVKRLVESGYLINVWMSNSPDVEIFRGELGNKFKLLINILQLEKSQVTHQEFKSTGTANQVTVQKFILHLDAQSLDNVYLDKVFNLGLTMFQSESKKMDSQLDEALQDGEVQVLWPAGESYIPLEMEINAPDCEIIGASRRFIQCYPNLDLPPFWFQLIPKAVGRRSIVINILQDNHYIGSAKVSTNVIKPNGTGLPKDPKRKRVRKLIDEYVDFELNIGLDGHIHSHSSIEGDQIAAISLEVPSIIQINEKMIKQNNINDDKQIREFGESLYSLLFPGAIHTHFIQTEAVARNNNQKVRIRLAIESDVLAKLPLEFTYRQDGGYFLSTNPDTVLSRYLNLPLPRNQVRKQRGSLHMLIIVSTPKDPRLVHLDPDEWEKIILDELKIPIHEGLITTQTVKIATHDEIKRALLTQTPHIIQFVGHGIYQNGKGYLALVNSDREGTWIVDDGTFADIFLGSSSKVGLVCLATCESAKSDSPQGFLGIAPKLIQRGFPAVVAMQYPVLISSAKVFLKNFYQDLAARKPVDWAVQDARNAVSIQFGKNNREFATPVLYMRAKDGQVF